LTSLRHRPLATVPALPQTDVSMHWVELSPDVGLPPGFGIYVDPGDWLIGGCLIRNRAYELHMVSAIRSVLKPGQVFLDIGANVGFHTLVGVQAVGPRGKVLAVEMSPVNCTLLRASLRRNGISTVTLFPCAATEKPGTVSFSVTPRTGNGMLVNDWLEERIRNDPQNFSPATAVPAFTIDSLVPDDQAIHVVKMDIEGSEFRALMGMIRLIRCWKPSILFEFNPGLLRVFSGIEPTELLDTLRGFGYRIHHIISTGSASGRFGERELTNEEAVQLATLPNGVLNLADFIALPEGK